MALILDIRCGDEDHEVEVELGKPMVLRDHDLRTVQAFSAFGAEKPDCLWMYEHWARAFEPFAAIEEALKAVKSAPVPKRAVRQLANALDSTPLLRAFMHALPWGYKTETFDPSGEFTREDLLRSLATLLSRQFDRDFIAAPITAEYVYALVVAMPDDFEDLVELTWDVIYTPDEYERLSESETRYNLSISGIHIGEWSVFRTRRLTDPIWFESEIEETTKELRKDRGQDEAILSVLKALTLEEDAPDASTEPPSLFTPTPCDESDECEHAVLYTWLPPDAITIVPYKTEDEAREALEMSEEIFRDEGRADDYSMSVVARSHVPGDREELLRGYLDTERQSPRHGLFPIHTVFKREWEPLLSRLPKSDQLRLLEWREL
jgi:hypothetical protein